MVVFGWITFFCVILFLGTGISFLTDSSIEDSEMQVAKGPAQPQKPVKPSEDEFLDSIEFLFWAGLLVLLCLGFVCLLAGHYSPGVAPSAAMYLR